MRSNRRLFLLMAAGFIAPLGVRAQARPAVDPDHFQSMRWRNIGPFRGGRSVAATGVTSDPLTYYFGGVGSGVWKTADAGTTWSNVSDTTFGSSSVGAIEVAPSDANVIFVGMGEHAIRGVTTSHGDGVYKSTDAGRSWRHIGLDRTRAISRIRVHPTNPDIVYVAAQGAPYGATEDRGVYRSLDGGVTWEKVLYISESAGASDISMDPKNPRILYAAFWDHIRLPWKVRSGGDGSGIWKTVDGGNTWEQLKNGFPELMGKTSVSVAANSDRVYAIIEADPGGGLYRSDDAGDSWRNVNDTWTIRARAWYYTEVFADPQNRDVVWVLNAPAMKSIDGGATFSRVRTPHGDNHDLWINPTNSSYVINANDGGANVSLNGGDSWSTQRNQATAQFYRVNVDNRFPYYVYGGQQDNSAIAIVSQTSGGGIGWKDWYSVAGCESAYLAFDPDDPELNFGGCYMGQISEYNSRTGAQRNIMAYPVLPAALASRDMKYRFNWNAPIITSHHDPNVLYHAGNVLLRTEDRGTTWTEISPDLTRDEDDKQGPGGGPITNEGAGGEIYNTIHYVAESPRDPATIWVGTDDGLVHVTRDGGASWTDVTPSNIVDGLINAIDASPHDPGVAYVVHNRYKFNDFTPHVYRTSNYGDTWEHIADGIAEEAHVRVVREDPARRGLLYAGTETGLYVSWNDGDDWQSIQLNMPLTPITDLIVQQEHNDLVAATQGRSFWILDDLTPLQQLNLRAEPADFRLLPPKDAYRVAGGGGFGSNQTNVGQNPSPGAVIDFYIGEANDSTPVTIEISDDVGNVIRSFTSASERDDGVDSLQAQTGHNRFAWNLRHQNVPNVPGAYVFGSLRGRRVTPARYEVRLRQGDRTETRDFNVLRDPRVDATPGDFVAQDALLQSITAELVEITGRLVAVRSVREQVNALLERTDKVDNHDVIEDAGASLTERLTSMEDSLLQTRTVDGQTVINFPSRLRFHYIYLRGALDGHEGVVTGGARQMFTDLSNQWSGLRAEVDGLLGPELDEFNQLVANAGIPAIIAPARGELIP